MKISAAALSFLVLAATLGSPAHGAPAHESLAHDPRMAIQLLKPRNEIEGMYRPADCCLSYTPRTIRCVFMESYFATTSGCSQPGVVFITKRGQHVCANPINGGVQNCIMDLKQDSAENLRKILA